MWISQSNGISESKREVASKPIDDPKPRPLKPSPQPIAVTPRPQPLVQPEPVSQPEPKREPVKPELDRNPDSKSTLEAQTKGDVERPTAKPHAPVGKQASPPKGEEGDEQLSPIPAAAEAQWFLTPKYLSPQNRPPVPSNAAQAAATNLIKMVHGDKMAAAKTAMQKLTLAHELLQARNARERTTQRDSSFSSCRGNLQLKHWPPTWHFGPLMQWHPIMTFLHYT